MKIYLQIVTFITLLMHVFHNFSFDWSSHM